MEVEQRPREKALRYGLESLSDLELVALILQSGNKNRSVLVCVLCVCQPVPGLRECDKAFGMALSQPIHKPCAVQPVLSLADALAAVLSF